ncbi:MAG TPA: retropepsin-like aspartic protease [Candidatus Cybelea sp.]
MLSTAPAAAATPTAALLDALRKATLGRPIGSITSIHTTGSMEAVGIRATAAEWDDVRAGRFYSSQAGGALTGASGWTGSVAWNQDYSGLVTVDGGIPGRQQAIDQAYLATLGYLKPGAGGAVVVYAGSRSDNGRTYDVLAVTPANGSEIDLWLDEQTHLIARENTSFGNVSATTVLSNYHRVDGLTYPFLTSTRTSEGNATSSRTGALVLNEPIGERMNLPAQHLHDFSIAGATTATVPVQVVNNHLYVSVMLNGRGPYTFVLDSGGDYIVTPELARRLGAKTSGEAQLGGVGSQTEGAAFARIDSIGVGSAKVGNQYVLVLPIATGFGMGEGMQIDGMLGYQFLARYVTTIDYANAKMTLTMPASASPPAGSASLPFIIDGTIPRIDVGVDGVTTSAEVDTGSRAALTLAAPFLAQNPTIAALAKTPVGVTGFGVGGPSFGRLGRIPNLTIGPFTIANSIADFTSDKSGAFSNPYNPANLGGGVWRRFVVTFDYGKHALYLVKSAAFDSSFPYDRSGLFLIDRAGEFTVLSAIAGSPAAAAGLAKDDVIVSVDGGPASRMSLAALRGLLSGSAGTVVHLHVRNATGERDVNLKLADYV